MPCFPSASFDHAEIGLRKNRTGSCQVTVVFPFLWRCLIHHQVIPQLRPEMEKRASPAKDGEAILLLQAWRLGRSLKCSHLFCRIHLPSQTIPAPKDRNRLAAEGLVLGQAVPFLSTIKGSKPLARSRGILHRSVVDPPSRNLRLQGLRQACRPTQVRTRSCLANHARRARAKGGCWGGVLELGGRSDGDGRCWPSSEKINGTWRVSEKISG